MLFIWFPMFSSRVVVYSSRSKIASKNAASLLEIPSITHPSRKSTIPHGKILNSELTLLAPRSSFRFRAAASQDSHQILLCSTALLHHHTPMIDHHAHHPSILFPAQKSPMGRHRLPQSNANPHSRTTGIFWNEALIFLHTILSPV